MTWTFIDDPWTWEPMGGAGCFYWVDSGDPGDGIVSSQDLGVLRQALSGSVTTQYNGVYPSNQDTHDLDGDDAVSSTDLGILIQILSGIVLPDLGLPTRPSGIILIDSPSGAVAVGETCSVTASVTSVGGKRTPGYGIVFEIDASSTGSAVLLGGNGDAGPGKRYSLTGEIDASAGGEAAILLKVTAPGSIIINASIPQCGTGPGRYAPAVTESAMTTITGL